MKFDIRNIMPNQKRRTVMRPATDIADVDDKLTRAIMAESDLAETEVQAALAWVVDTMTTRSRFNAYHDFDKTVRHIQLAISAPCEDLEFSLEAHGFQALPSGQPVERMLTAITVILAKTTALKEHIWSLPTL